MKKYIIGAAMLVAVYASPLLAQAQTTGLTTDQISAIISLLQVFGADQSVIDNTRIALNGGTPTPTPQTFCHTFNSDLTFGSAGADVSALNQALSLDSQGELGASTVFTENTAAAVVQFQTKYGIRQTGYVGPLTRTKLNALYGCNNYPRPVPPTPSVFSASPTSGSAPLSVLFTAGGFNPSNYQIDFGDGNSVICNKDQCEGSSGWNAQHIYNAAGTYTAKLTRPSACNATPGTSCTQEIVSTATITVGGQQDSQLGLVYPTTGQTFSPGDTINVQWKSLNLAGTQINVTLDSVDAQRHLATFIPVEKGSTTVILPVSDSLGTLRDGPAVLSISVTGIKDGDPRAVYAKVAITIRGLQNPAPSATIDQNSLNQSTGSFAITGSATNSSGVTVFLAPLNYSTYAPVSDYTTIAGQIGKDGFYQLSSDVVSGRWSTSFLFNNVSTSFLVLVYDTLTRRLLTTGTLTVNGGLSSCIAPHITVPSPLPGYSVTLSPGQNNIGQSFTADQSVTYSLQNAPSWVHFDTVHPNIVNFALVPTTPGVFSFTIVATNSCGKSDAETIPVIVSGGSTTPMAATIDQSSLTSTSGTPTITGTASGSSSNFGISIGTGAATNPPTGDKAYGSGNIPVVNGRWSVTVSPALTSGTYGVYVYGDNILLTTGTLTIGTPATAIGTYQGYMNGALFITTNNVPQSYAIDNCRSNAALNPTANLRCTWNGIEVFNNTATPVLKLTLLGATVNPVLIIDYCGLPATNVQGFFLYSASNQGNAVLSVSATASCGFASMPIPSSVPRGSYFIRVLGVINNETLAQSATFVLPALN